MFILNVNFMQIILRKDIHTVILKKRNEDDVFQFLIEEILTSLGKKRKKTRRNGEFQTTSDPVKSRNPCRVSKGTSRS